MRLSSIAVASLLSLSLFACDNGSDDASDGGQCDGAKCDEADGDGDSEDFQQQSYCLGVRGNGELITAHCASMSRIIEHYGKSENARLVLFSYRQQIVQTRCQLMKWSSAYLEMPVPNFRVVLTLKCRSSAI